MTVHLTDDEVVAVCGLFGLAWPNPLPTVALESAELQAASRRGVRSLTVRALLRVDPETDQPVIDGEVAQAISTVVSGSPRLVSGVIDASGELLASSSAAYVVEASDGSVLLVTTTATGIHVLTPSSLTEAQEAFIALVDNALTAGLDATQEARLLVVRAGEPERALAVSKGSVSVGAVNEESAFVGSSAPEPDWDRARLAVHLAVRA